MSFEDRKQLLDKDLLVIKELGLKFRGKNQWPSFLSYRPGYYPWRMNGRECRFLTVIINQSMEIARRFRDDDALLDRDEYLNFLVRVPSGKGTEIIWADQFLKVELPEKPTKCLTINDDLLKELKSLEVKKSAVWEVGLFYSRVPVQENKDERPFFPKVFLLVDRNSGLILNYEMISDKDKEFLFCNDAVIDQITKGKKRPSVIYANPIEVVNGNANVRDFGN